jgi:hypothetical protein
MTATEGYCMEYRAPLRERIGRWLGFHHPYVQRPESDLWMVTVTHVHLSFLDRLRVLATGHLVIEAVTETDVIVAKAVTRSAASIVL